MSDFILPEATDTLQESRPLYNAAILVVNKCRYGSMEPEAADSINGELWADSGNEIFKIHLNDGWTNLINWLPHTHDSDYYTKTEIDILDSAVQAAANTYTDDLMTAHEDPNYASHDERYFTQSQINNKVANLQDGVDACYTKTESDGRFVQFNVGDQTIGGNITVLGDFTVQGTLVSVDSTNLDITDNIITLNKGEAGTGVSLSYAGLEIDRGTADNAVLRLNDAGATPFFEADAGDGNGFKTIALLPITHDSTTQRNATGSHPATAISYDHTTSGLTAIAVQAAIDELDSGLDAHIANTSNPHSVTAAQIGGSNILAELLTVDGPDSGLDADRLDGHDSTYFEPAFTKNTAFNKDFGITAGTVSEGNHVHTALSVTYDHTTSGLVATEVQAAIDELKTLVSASGDGNVVGPANSITDRIAVFDGTTGKIIKDGGNLISDLALASHNHDATYLGITAKAADSEKLDNHDSTYFEPAFTKNTAFNKNFGTTAGTVSEGNHNHDATYLGITAKAADSEKLDNHDSAEFPLLAALNTFTATQTIKNGVAGASKNYILLQPTDYGTGKPELIIKSGTSADEFKFALWDGSTNDGTINLSASNVKAPSFVENEVALSDKYLGITAQAADSAKLGGATASDAASNSTIVKRTANGYIYANHFNTSAGASSSDATNYYFDSGDGYIRKKTLANTKTELIVASEVLAKIKTVDGTTSGLDSDLIDGKHVWTGTQTDYDNIGTKDANTIYFITG